MNIAIFKCKTTILQLSSIINILRSEGSCCNKEGKSIESETNVTIVKYDSPNTKHNISLFDGKLQIDTM